MRSPCDISPLTILINEAFISKCFFEMTRCVTRNITNISCFSARAIVNGLSPFRIPALGLYVLLVLLILMYLYNTQTLVLYSLNYLIANGMISDSS